MAPSLLQGSVCRAMNMLGPTGQPAQFRRDGGVCFLDVRQEPGHILSLLALLTNRLTYIFWLCFRDMSVVPVAWGSWGDVLGVSMVTVTLSCREWGAAVC